VLCISYFTEFGHLHNYKHFLAADIISSSFVADARSLYVDISADDCGYRASDFVSSGPPNQQYLQLQRWYEI